MRETEYKPVPHDHDAFLKKALKRKGFGEVYERLEEEYALARQRLSAHSESGIEPSTEPQVPYTQPSVKP